MGFSKYIENIERIDQLIRLKATGTPNELAQKLKISKRWVYEYIAEMKALNAPIIYDKVRKSFIYHSEGCFDMHFKKSL